MSHRHPAFFVSSVTAFVSTLMLQGCGGGDGGASGTSSSSSTTGAASTPLTIVTQPANLTVTDGAPASFSISASGKQPVTYQWEQGSTPVPGATTATLSIPTTIYTYNNGTPYSVVVTDASGSQLASQAERRNGC
jgi:hypothetical protein